MDSRLSSSIGGQSTTLRASYLASTRNNKSFTAYDRPTTQDDLNDLDEELSQAQLQVDQADKALNTIKNELKVKIQAHESELKSLNEQIEKDRVNAETRLAVQESDQSDEYRILHDKLESQILKYQSQFDTGAKMIEDQTNQITEYKKARTAWKVTDMVRSVEYQQTKKIESDLNKSLKRAEQLSMTSSSIQGNKRYMKDIEKEIFDLQSQRRDIQMQSRVNEIELNTRINANEQDHRIAVQKLRTELENRAKDFQRHIADTKERIKKERQMAEFEVNETSERCANLQKVLQNVQRRGMQQMSKYASDIEKLQSALNEATRSEERFVGLNRESNMKLQGLRQKTAELRGSVEAMEAEIAALRGENESIVAELSKKSRTQIQTSARRDTLSRSTYRSRLYKI